MSSRDVQEMNGIRIRAFEERDVAAFMRIHSQASVAANTLQIPHQQLAEMQQRFVAQPSQRNLVAEIGGQVVGVCGLTLYARRQAHVGAIGMGVDESAQGRGVGTAMLESLLDLADNWYNLRRLQLEVYTDNAVAIRLYEKYGFQIEGLHRAYAYRLGEFVDAYSMARLREGPRVLRD
jgi:L-phenylalanine/L-methionine N-acetyltransferase